MSGDPHVGPERRVRLRGVVLGEPGEVFGRGTLTIVARENEERPLELAERCRIRADGGDVVSVDLRGAQLAPETWLSGLWREHAEHPVCRGITLPEGANVRVVAEVVRPGDEVELLAEQAVGDGPWREAPTARALLVTTGEDRAALLDEIAAAAHEDSRYLAGDRWPAILGFLFAAAALWFAIADGRERAPLALALAGAAAFLAAVCAQRRITGTWGFWWMDVPEALTVFAWPLVFLPGAGIVVAIVLGRTGVLDTWAFSAWVFLAAALAATTAWAGTGDCRAMLRALVAGPPLGAPFVEGARGVIAGTVAEWTPPGAPLRLSTSAGPLGVTRPGSRAWMSTIWREREPVRDTRCVMSVPVGGRAIVAGQLARRGGRWVLEPPAGDAVLLFATAAGDDPRRAVGRRLLALRAACLALSAIALAAAWVALGLG